MQLFAVGAAVGGLLAIAHGAVAGAAYADVWRIFCSGRCVQDVLFVGSACSVLLFCLRMADFLLWWCLFVSFCSVVRGM